LAAADSDLNRPLDLRRSLADGAHGDPEEPLEVTIENPRHAARPLAAIGMTPTARNCSAFFAAFCNAGSP